MIKLYGVFFLIILLKKFKLDSKKHEICKHSYANHRQCNLDIFVGDCIFLKTSPMKNVLQYGKKRKLNP
jgi:hypothetical protein